MTWPTFIPVSGILDNRRLQPGLGIAGFGSVLAHMLWRIVDKAEESVDKEEESANAWNLVGLEATDDGVEGLRAHHIDPIVDRGDAAHHHRKEGTKHIFW